MACLQPFPHQTTKICSENLILEIIFCIKFIQSFWWALGGLLIARESPEMTSLWGIDSLLAFLRSTTHKIEKPISFPCHRKHLHPPSKKKLYFSWHTMAAITDRKYCLGLEQDPHGSGYSTQHDTSNAMHTCLLLGYHSCTIGQARLQFFWDFHSVHGAVTQDPTG